jgi:hypothetical protein
VGVIPFFLLQLLLAVVTALEILAWRAVLAAEVAATSRAVLVVQEPLGKEMPVVILPLLGPIKRGAVAAQANLEQRVPAPMRA